MTRIILLSGGVAKSHSSVSFIVKLFFDCTHLRDFLVRRHRTIIQKEEVNDKRG